jgi:hypothetical protein
VAAKSREIAAHSPLGCGIDRAIAAIPTFGSARLWAVGVEQHCANGHHGTAGRGRGSSNHRHTRARTHARACVRIGHSSRDCAALGSTRWCPRSRTRALLLSAKPPLGCRHWIAPMRSSFALPAGPLRRAHYGGTLRLLRGYSGVLWGALSSHSPGCSRSRSWGRISRRSRSSHKVRSGCVRTALS